MAQPEAVVKQPSETDCRQAVFPDLDPVATVAIGVGIIIDCILSQAKAFCSLPILL